MCFLQRDPCRLLTCLWLSLRQDLVLREDQSAERRKVNQRKAGIELLLLARRGKRIVTRAPPMAERPNSNSALWFFAICCIRYRPRPVPSDLDVSNKVGCQSSSGKPHPLSPMESSTDDGNALRSTVRRRGSSSGSVCSSWIELLNRILMARLIWLESPLIQPGPAKPLNRRAISASSSL